MSAPPRFDLALAEALNDRINAVRDVKRAEEGVKVAHRERRPLGVENALRALNNAQGKAQALGRLLDAAISQEAAERQ
jgi:hypothetical protein